MLSDDDSDGDDEGGDDEDESESSGPQAWIGLKYNKTAQRFEWENGAQKRSLQKSQLCSSTL